MDDKLTAEQWKEMYLHLARQTEKAVALLIRAQQACEKMYVDAGGAEASLPDRWVVGEVVGASEKPAFLKMPEDPDCRR